MQNNQDKKPQKNHNEDKESEHNDTDSCESYAFSDE
jgi:hypothetical protein